MKHVSGDLNRWIARFEDQVETCKLQGRGVRADHHQETTSIMKFIRGEESRSYGEARFKAEEDGCHICHFYKSCKKLTWTPRS